MELPHEPIQRPAFSAWHHSVGRTLNLLQIRHPVTVSCRMLAERGECRSLHDLPLGSALCAWNGKTAALVPRNLSIARGKDENNQWPLGVSNTGPSSSRGRTVDFISPPVITTKLHTGFWVKSSTTWKEVADPRFINTDKAPPMVARLLSQTRRPVPVWRWTPTD